MSSTPPSKPPVMSPSEPLAQYWDKSVAQLCTLADAAVAPADQERHRIYCLLLMSLVSSFFNGTSTGKKGRTRGARGSAAPTASTAAGSTWGTTSPASALTATARS